MAMDFEKICRVCLKSSDNKQLFDIYTSYDMKRNTLYSEMLSTCTKLKPEKEDGLPRLICKECSRQLKRVYTFNIQCEESEQKLKCYLENQQDIENIKTENLDVKTEGIISNLKSKCESIIDNEKLQQDNYLHFYNNVKEDVKLESNFDDKYDSTGNVSCWDAEDDNIILLQIKSTENLKAPENEVDKPRKKKRKKREPSFDDDNLATDMISEDAENDNIILGEIKSTKVLEDTENDVEKPKKRGRKKRVYLEGETPQLPESKMPHKCDECGKVLSTKSNLKAHKICHTDLRPYKCGDCTATFRGHSALFQHRKVHTGETPYHCEYCPKQFSRRTGLVSHIRIHTGEKLYSCDICFKNFVQSAQLSIHMKRHTGDKPYLCQVCGKGFPINADLKVHQRIHNGEKPYSCHLCTKTFATSGNLSIHIRIHNKEIRYNCKECHRGFVTNSAYNVHLKRHKGQRDYHCECGKTFYTSSALKQHKVVHTGEKKYQCKICDRKFTQTSHLSRHFKRDHAKPNMPVPSSDHYKLIIQDASKSVFGMKDIQILAPNVNMDVKCEGS